MRSKKHRLSVVMGWINKFEPHASARYALDPERLGFDPTKEIVKLTANQLKLMAAIVSGAYNVGAEETRQHFRELRERKANRSPLDLSRFRVIQGGEAQQQEEQESNPFTYGDIPF